MVTNGEWEEPSAQIYDTIYKIPSHCSISLTWISRLHRQDYSLSGHQLVCHFVGSDYRCPDFYNPVDGDEVPVPHFGLAVGEYAMTQLCSLSVIVVRCFPAWHVIQFWSCFATVVICLIFSNGGIIYKMMLPLTPWWSSSIHMTLSSLFSHTRGLKACPENRKLCSWKTLLEIISNSRVWRILRIFLQDMISSLLR